ncbi:hypothetical protein IU449_28440 [Nocardia higoensis]|uniref:Uncharacterized protein n=1 Tax=Nocardia higoensis TaxID=228599 RepID=A0ABS0DJ22_9NOCA|nr:hypothetical protein [Nocardia higoensis]MBF6358429.1 hypothetical protein [Nocardia higoensis]
MIGPVVKTDDAVMRAGSRAYGALPPVLQGILLVLALLVGVVGCSIAWVDQQSYVPSPNICRVHEVQRTDCQHVQRVTPTLAGVQR